MRSAADLVRLARLHRGQGFTVFNGAEHITTVIVMKGKIG